MFTSLKSVLLKTTVLSLAASSALADRGGGHVGGGDPCEDSFKEHSRYLHEQIRQDLPERLEFSSEWSAARYRTEMMEVISTVVDEASPKPVIECTTRKIKVNGTEKVCRSWKDGNDRPRVECNRKAYLGLSPRLQVRLTHHEWARLQGVEKTTRGDSDYRISDQVIGLLSPLASGVAAPVLLNYPEPYCTYSYVQGGEIRYPDGKMAPVLAKALQSLGCKPLTAARSRTNHLTILSSAEPGSGAYGDERVDLIEKVYAETVVYLNGSPFDSSEPHDAGVSSPEPVLKAKEDVLSLLSLNTSIPRAIPLDRYRKASERAWKKTEAEIADRIGSVLR